MRLLFTSDLHGQPGAFTDFAARLKSGPYDLGVLGGDLLDEWLPDDDVLRLTGARADELIDDLPGPDETDPVALWNKSGAKALQDRARCLRIAELQEHLAKAEKPIFFVLGNHDRGDWPDHGQMTNLHLKRVEFQDRAFVGYRWTNLDRTPEEIDEDFEILRNLVDRETVLVTHSPPWGILDGEPGGERNYGLPMLNRLKPKPRVHLVGHVHSLAGRRGRYVNGSWPVVRRFFPVTLGDLT